MNTIKFLVSSNPAAYGPEATPQDVQDYAIFAHQYLLKHGHDEVEIEYVEQYPPGSADTQADLRKEIWSAFRP
ncbi:MAG TPA: hypothetical protein VGJ22_01750 [Anaerolineales bacterium]|jgi:hypothetical protein